MCSQALWAFARGREEWPCPGRNQVEAETPGNVRVLFEETEEGATMRGERVEKLPAKELGLATGSLKTIVVIVTRAEILLAQIYLPFSLQKIDRVTFGIMSSEQVAAALAEQPLMPLTRAKLAIPFVGKDVPSQSSEFAHPDVVIGLTILAYRYEGLRREDFDEVLGWKPSRGMLCDRLEAEAGAVLERLAISVLWQVALAAELDAQTSAEVLGLEEGDVQMTKPDRLRPRVPLGLLEPAIAEKIRDPPDGRADG
ncbi:hypothetical protein AK812_SmicGene7191 [Symbiodinium microadriaticum]|uniref:ubiquitinyl hydrolase 1 n=1 Tax=Symbiodinium microadriaticum TaxID=2951 RepID=A0A1Q9EP58_SYMMI|nr:hypothetical protein AK812_SmicGene7191 [Symbiodinium microadriaticum]